MTLQAAGEPDWPFGLASGRLVLKEGKDKISQTDFEWRYFQVKKYEYKVLTIATAFAVSTKKWKTELMSYLINHVMF